MSEVKSYIIVDPVCKHAGITFKWIPGDKLGVYAHQHLTYRSEDKPTKWAPLDAKIHEIRLDVIIFHPIVRKLINESNGAFLVGQKLATEFPDDAAEVRLELIKLSKQYRCIIKACIENLQEEASESSSAEEKHTQLNLVKIFYNIEFLWHLCEILYVDLTPGDTVLPQLLEWIQFHFFKCERRAIAMLSGDFGASTLESGIESEPDYWETVTALVLQGRLPTALALLRYHSSANSVAFKAADATLRTMPAYQVYGGLSAVEFSMRWKCWQNDLRAKLQAGTFATDPALEFLMKLAAGDEEAFDEVRDQCETWYQYMAAWLLYTEPTVKLFDLCFHAKQAVRRFGGSAALQHTDYVIVALMESDLHLVIKLIEQTTENGWFAAHLTNLLFHCGSLNIIDSQQTNVTHRLHEMLLLDYGSLLMSHDSLWQVGATYLDHCPTEGRARLQLLLPRVRLDTEAKALKVIQVATERDMQDIVGSVCKVMGKRSERRGRLGNALTWALRSQDSAYATCLANRFLDDYNAEGKFKAIDLLDNLGSCMMVCERLTFLAKYCEFHQLYGLGEFREAASLLVSLVDARLGPKSFWLNMLTDAVPLLESNELLLPVEDSHKLMDCLEELEDDGELGEKGDLIRLALARNLDRAMVQNIEEGGDLTMSDDLSNV